MLNKDFFEYIENNSNLKSIMDSLYPKAQDGRSWICPVCGKGSPGRRHKDGIKLDPKRPGKLHCFSGKHQFDGNLIDLIAEEYNIGYDSPEQRKEAINKTKELIGYIDAGYNPRYERQASQDKTKSESRPKIHTHYNKMPEQSEHQKQELKEIQQAISGEDVRLKEIIEQARANIEDPKASRYLESRGISLETARRYGVGYIKDKTTIGFTKDSVTGELKPQNVWNSLIFADTLASFGTRSLDADTSLKTIKPSLDSKGNKYHDIPYMLQNAVKQRDKKRDDKGDNLEPIFIVEGQFDALSIAEAGADAISLNGGQNTNKLIEILKAYKVTRPLILALDNDPAGIKAQDRAYKAFKDAGLEVYHSNFLKAGADLTGIEKLDPNEYLTADPQAFKGDIEQDRRIPTAEFDATFNNTKYGEFLDALDKRVNAPAIPTGFTTLDGEYFLDGGLYEGLYIIGAISSLGKTTYMLQVADQIAKSGQDVLYISLEMSTEELIARSISRYTALDGINTTKPERLYTRTLRDVTDKKRWKNFSPQEMNHLIESIQAYFKDTGDTMRIIQRFGDLSVDEIRSLVKEHVHHRGKPPVVFIDYLQILAPPADQKRSLTDKQIVDHNVKSLKQLSVDYKIPIFVISAFNRENYNNEVSMLSFRESSSIEYSSDVLIGLERVKQPRKEGNTEQARINYNKAVKELEEEERRTGIREVRLKIIKNRNGQTGGRILYRYFYKNFYFQEAGDENLLKNDSFKSRLLKEFQNS